MGLSTYSGYLLLKNGKIFDPFNDKMFSGSILLKNGKIDTVGDAGLPENCTEIDCTGKIVTVGFTDIHAHFREPGREDKETLETGSLAALAGGFTEICVMPNTDPVLDTPESIRFIIEKAAGLPVTIHPIGAITTGQRGEGLAEIGEMVRAGAVGISDDGIPLSNGLLMRYALEYGRMYDVPVINHAEDISLRGGGQINEGELSTRLGLSGIPDISESVMVYRDLALAEYTGGRLHIPHVSSRKSVGLIRQFKEKGVNVSAEVSPHHLGLTEMAARDFDTNLKVAPPIRSEADRLALIEGLIDGTLDCIATDHAPHTIEEKEKDFINAPGGMIGLESAFGMVHTVLTAAGASTQDIIKWLSVNPQKVFNLPGKQIVKGARADLVVIDPRREWVFKEENIVSRSHNTPMVGMNFTGKVELTIRDKYIFRTAD
ncbi:MAG: dihydroorotase [FCB group bacterium]|nr:dihydroorotase [FCB group bacterium]